MRTIQSKPLVSSATCNLSSAIDTPAQFLGHGFIHAGKHKSDLPALPGSAQMQPCALGRVFWWPVQSHLEINHH